MIKQLKKQKDRCYICEVKVPEDDVNELILDNGKLICPMCDVIITEIRHQNIQPFKITNHMRFG